MVAQMGEQFSATLDLSQRVGEQWANIESARKLSQATLRQLREAFSDSDSTDTSIVVYGSLAREEFTSGSDIDWNLIVDGIADPNHHRLFLDAEQRIKRIAPKAVGREGTFEALASSHDLIHKIGGEDDTNRNLTRRLLLLLESTPVGNSMAHERLVKNILKRYLQDDRSFWVGTTVHKHHIPHFLLNDPARFWRTMAVDFAYKLRTRSGQGWAIRNMKLRTSRKLLYAAGLLGCFRCHLEIGGTVSYDMEPLITEGVQGIYETPLDMVARFLLDHRHLDTTTAQLFGAYDDFLGLLADHNSRKHLEDLPENEAKDDPVYRRARDISHRFRDALLDLFFDAESGLAELTRLYGVF